MVWKDGRIGIPRLHAARVQGCMLQVSRTKCFRVVGLGLYLDGLFGTKYSSFHQPNICSSVFGRVFWRERAGRSGLGHIVRFLPRTDMSAALQTKNYVEVEEMISALQCRHLFASKKYSFQLTLVHRRVSSPQFAYHAIIVYGVSLQRPLGSEESLCSCTTLVCFTRATLFTQRGHSCTPSCKAWAEIRMNSNDEQVWHKVCRKARLLGC